MRRFTILLIILLGTAVMQSPTSAASKYLWNQEFNSKVGTVDLKYWNFELGDGSDRNLAGWGNSELEFYTKENAKLDGSGNLAITAKRLSKSELKICYYGPCLFTSSRLTTKGKLEFQYGRIETRLKMPAGEGTWPAFWALGADIDQNAWPNSGEIDFVEALGRTPRTVYGTVHGPGYSGGSGITGELTISKPLSSAFHIYTVDWLPGQITWKIDGKVFHKVTKSDVGENEWVFDKPFFLVANLAMGGNFGGMVGPSFKSSSAFLIDYIRISKLDGYGEIIKGA
jgi:beta-glucanase (GH16 family)